MSEFANMIRMYNILEKDTNELGSIIHFDKKNHKVFGIRIYHLLFMSCNLFEVAAKKLTDDNFDAIVQMKISEGKSIANARRETKKNNMDVWKLVQIIRQYSDQKLVFIPIGCEFKPLEELGESEINSRNITWWQDYNSVKHDLSKIEKATLRNLIYALSSAGLLLSQLAHPEGIHPVNRSILFNGLFIPDI